MKFKFSKPNLSGLLNVRNLFFSFAAGILLLCLIKFFPVQQKDKSDGQSQTSCDFSNDYINHTENDLEQIISQIHGVDNVHVFVTYENDGKKMPVSDTKDATVVSNDKTETNHEKNTVIQKDQTGEHPFVYENSLPDVRGVLIVVSGAGDKSINAEITEAVSAVLDVPIHKVKILQGK